MLLRVLFRSIRAAGATSDFIVLVPQGNPALVFQKVLEDDGMQVVEVPPMPLPSNMQIGQAIDKWAFVLNKFCIWSLTQYSKIALFDSDMLVLGNGNPETLFHDCEHAELCMVPQDFTPEDELEVANIDGKMLNAGLMVASPSMQRFHQLKEAIQQDHREYRYPEQQLITNFVANRTYGMRFKFLQSEWNSCTRSTPMVSGVVHFCGSGKPTSYSYPICSLRSALHDNSSKSSGCSSPAVRAWQQHLMAVDPCVTIGSSQDCRSTSTATGHSCQWCSAGDYCMDNRLRCIEKTHSEDFWYY